MKWQLVLIVFAVTDSALAGLYRGREILGWRVRTLVLIIATILLYLTSDNQGASPRARVVQLWSPLAFSALFLLYVAESFDARSAVIGAFAVLFLIVTLLIMYKASKAD